MLDKSIYKGNVGYSIDINIIDNRCGSGFVIFTLVFRVLDSLIHYSDFGYKIDTGELLYEVVDAENEYEVMDGENVYYNEDRWTLLGQNNYGEDVFYFTENSKPDTSDNIFAIILDYLESNKNEIIEYCIDQYNELLLK